MPSAEEEAALSDTVPLRGLAQLNVFADDVAAARDWYAGILGVEAYFQMPDAESPQYAEFRIGDLQTELGIVDRRFAPEDATGARGGAIARWHVDDLRSAVTTTLAAGAAEWEPVIERTGGFVTASVLDPFGNVLGLIQSPHYLEMLVGG